MTDRRIEASVPAAAALACAVTDGDAQAVAAALTGADLPALAVVLAANVDVDSPLRTHPSVSVVHQAIVRSAAAFSTTQSAILSPTKRREVAAARAVAMAACRMAGMTLWAIGEAFGRDHTTVLYAATRCGEDPKLRRIVLEIVSHLPNYVGPTINEEVS